jgi:lipopolysaccharide assembly outer membrane protein LptD (OstA)
MKRLASADLRLLSRNPSDRVDDEKVLEIGLGNRFFGAASPNRPVRQLAELRIFSGYDFERGQLTNLYLESSLEPSQTTRLDFVFGYDSKKTRVDEALVRVGWSHPGGHLFSSSYRYLRNIPLIFEDFEFDRDYKNFDSSFDRVNQLDVDVNLRVSSRLDLFLLGDASFEDSSKAGTIGFILHSACNCWDLLASARKRIRPDDTSVNLEIRLSGLGFGLASPATQRR